MSSAIIGRRKFLQRAATTAALSFAGSAFSVAEAATARRPLRVDLTLAAQDQAVLEWLQGFASQIRFVGSSVLARLRGDTGAPAHWIASVEDLSRLGELLAGAKFTGLYTEGSTAFFKVGSSEVTVELLPADGFAARLADLARARVRFDHDSLVYDPATQSLRDPLRSKAARGLRFTRGNKDLGLAFAQVLDGLIGSHELGLSLTLRFKRFRHLILRSKAARPEVAQAVCAALFARLATWAGAAPVAEIEMVLKSRLVSGSLASVLGLDVAAAIANAKSQLGTDSAPNAAVWITALAGTDLSGLAGSWLLAGGRFDQLRSRAVLASFNSN